jgi:hypothetical protein
MGSMTRHPLILAAVAAALALGACGTDKDGGTRAGSSGTGEDTAFDGALKFAKCMRDHGLDFPDPTRTGDGGILQRGPGKEAPGGGPGKGDGPAVEKAEKACAKYQEHGGGPAPDPAEQAKLQDALIAYSRCMRGKGVAMPDPKFEGNKVTMRMRAGQGGPEPDSPAFKAADKACHPLMADLGPAGPGAPGGAAKATP